jgi:hypothetical protein
MPSKHRSSKRSPKRAASKGKRAASKGKRAASKGKRAASKGKRAASKGKLKLVKIAKSPIATKKLRATFSDGTHTDFGYKGMSDYTKHKDSARKQRYIARHKKREHWNSPKSAGALSRYVLWNKPSLRGSISDYKKRFGL